MGACQSAHCNPGCTSLQYQQQTHSAKKQSCSTDAVPCWQVLLSHGINEDDLEAELEEKLLEVDRVRNYDDGVNSVLVASAADEIASLRAQISSQADQIEQLNHRCLCLPAWLQNIALSTGCEQTKQCKMLFASLVYDHINCPLGLTLHYLLDFYRHHACSFCLIVLL